jgi:hypothetical protein
MSRIFLITSLASAGFSHPEPLQSTLTRASSGFDPEQGKLFQVFRQEHLYTLAGHTSHSSHSSHSSHMSGSGGHFSHSSHQSSSGGYSYPVYNPAPTYTPPPSPPPPPPPASSYRSPPSLYTAPSDSSGKSLPPLSGRSAMFKTVVMHVQVALMGRGDYDGPIDGTVGPALRVALRQFQQSQGLTVTGTITPQTLDALHVPSQ